LSAGSAALDRLAARLATEGDPLVPASVQTVGGIPGIPYRDGDPRFGDLVAAGPRTEPDPERYAFVVEAIREGYLCHYGESRLLDLPDPDVALLAGDLLYAIGLAELSAIGDLESTGILSDLIRVAADLRAAGHPDRAELMWIVQTTAVSCGKPASYRELLDAAAEDDPAAAGTLFGWAESAAERAGTEPELRSAVKAIHFPPSNL